MITASKKYLLNRMNQTASVVGLGDLVNQVENCVKAQYDFAELGGAVGDISLDLVIPANAIVTHAVIDVLTDPDSLGSATLAFKLQSAGDVLAATAMASVTGVLNGVPIPSDATKFIKTTAARTLKLTVGTAALTAGKINVFVKYVISE